MNPTLAPTQETAAEAARAWRASLPRDRRRSTVFRGVLVFMVSALAYLALFVGSFLLPLFWLRGLCLAFAPLAIGALFVVGHDAAHHSLTPVGWLNRLLGRLAMLPALHPFTSWTHAHNTMHHGWTNFKGRHPDFSPFSKEDYDQLPPWRRWLERVYRHPLGLGLYYIFDFYFKHLIVPGLKDRRPYRLWFHLDRLWVLAFVLLPGQCRPGDGIPTFPLSARKSTTSCRAGAAGWSASTAIPWGSASITPSISISSI